MGDKESNKEAADGAAAGSAAEFRDDIAAGNTEGIRDGAAAESTESLTDGDAVESTEKSTDGTAAGDTEEFGNSTTVKSTEKGSEEGSEEGSEKDTAGSKAKDKEANPVKKKTVKKRIVFAVLLVAALAYFLCYTGTHQEELTSTECHELSYVPDVDSEAEAIVLENEKEYKSVITAEQDGELTAITVRMDRVSPDFTGDLLFRIYTADGKEKASVWVPNIDLLANTADCVTVFNMAVPVSKGEKLWTSWMVTGNEGEDTRVYLYDNEKGESVLDGNSVEGKSLQQTGYQYVSCRRTVIFAVLITAAVLFLLFLNGKAVRYIRHVAVALLPMLTLYLWLTVTDNRGFLQGENFLPEIVGLYILLGLVLCIFNLRGGSILYLGMGFTVTLVNYYMESFRAQPLLITDIFSLRTALQVADNYTYTINYPMISVIMIYVDMLVLMITYSYKPGIIADAIPAEKGKTAEKLKEKETEQCTKGKKIRKGRIKILLRCGGVLLCLASYVVLGEYTDFALNSWDMTGVITERGWLMTNTVLGKTCLNNKLKGYNKHETIDFMAANEKEETADTAAVMPENLIVIMDESYADLSVLGELETDEEVMPFLNSLENGSRIEKGWMGVHVIGGGTISTEWEFLTGGNTGLMNLGSLFPYTLLQNRIKQYNYSGICSTLADAGYETIAMHPNLASNYGRKSVYPLLGFQEFYTIDNYYENADCIRSFVSEETDIDGIIAQYENKESDDLFVFNVTMQNHGGYGQSLDEYDVTASGIDCDELDCYLTLVHKSDQALERLLSYFDKVDEPTMIVFFGDHQPALPENFYDDIYGTQERNDEQQEKMFVTPYLIWSNYDRQTYDMPYINAGYLEAIVKAEIGLELNQWDRYLLGIMEKYPVVGKFGLFDGDYAFTSYDDLNDEQSEDLRQMMRAMYYWWTYH